MLRSCIALSCMALALALSACGGDDDSDKGSTSSSGTPTTDAKANRAPKEAEAAKRELQDQKEQSRELKQQKKDDQNFDKSFTESPFERLVGELPLRKPPLYVEQYITGEGHKVYTSVDPKRFCKPSAAQRQKAVKTFFETADKSFRAGGVNDFEQVVTPASDTIDKLPALATANANTVVLTSRGRSC